MTIVSLNVGILLMSENIWNIKKKSSLSTTFHEKCVLIRRNCAYVECPLNMFDEFCKNNCVRIFQHSPIKTSFACSSRSFVSWSLVLTVTNSICWRCKMTLSSPRTTLSVGLGHNKRVFPPQCAVQVAKDVLEDLTARLSHRFATHAQDHGLWNVLRSVKNYS